MSAATTGSKPHLQLVPALRPSPAPARGSLGNAPLEHQSIDNRALSPDAAETDLLDEALLDEALLDGALADVDGLDPDGLHPTSDRSRQAHPATIGAARAAATAMPRRARDLVQFPPELRRLRRDILAGGLAQGHAVSPDAVSVILAAKVIHQSPLLHFTEDIVWDLLWFDICNWCGLRRLEVPAGIVAAMWITLQHLHDNGLLDAHSDTIADLCTPLQTSGGLDPLGRKRFPG